MIEAYKMVLVNSIACLIVCSGLVLYRYIFPKKKIAPLFLLFLFSLLPLISLLRAGTYESGDFSVNVYKSKEEIGNMPALVAALFYLYAPYHLIDTNFRISIGEILSFVFLPLTLFFIIKWIKKLWLPVIAESQFTHGASYSQTVSFIQVY